MYKPELQLIIQSDVEQSIIPSPLQASSPEQATLRDIASLP